MCFSAPSPSTDNSAQQAAQQQAAQEQQRQQNIQTGMSKINDLFSPYNDSYYNQLYGNYMNFYQPQLDTQYKDAQSQLAYGLANQGLSNSSAAAKATSDLAKTYGQQESGIQAAANNYVNSAKASVGGVQQNLISNLNNSADPSQINQTALNQIAIQPVDSLSPLSNAFTGVLGNIGQSARNFTAATGTSPLAAVLSQSPYGQMGKTTSSGSVRYAY